MARWMGVLVTAAMLSACSHLPLGRHRPPRGGETITYQVSRCYGRCPAYAVTLGPDGQGIFTGEANTAVTGERRFRATPEQVRAFTQALAKLRPAGERLIEHGRPDCGLFATDSSSIDVTWQAADGVSHLTLDLGCHGDKARSAAETLRGLPVRTLPIQDMVGPH